MELRVGLALLKFFDDPTYLVGSVDNVRRYGRVYQFSEEFVPNTKLGIECIEERGTKHSCIILTSAGATGIHEHTAVLAHAKCFVAVGDRLCALSLPRLKHLWAIQIDSATCFGVYYSAAHNCLISHGELEIARVDFNGKIIWTAGGKDIFTGTLRLDDNFIFITDFNDEVYRIEIATGKSEIIVP